MSGPIVRKYGFPNFDKIFGERPLQHGGDEPEDAEGDVEGAKSSPKTSGTETEEKPDSKAKKGTASSS
jgi:hypothetical protein